MKITHDVVDVIHVEPGHVLEVEAGGILYVDYIAEGEYTEERIGEEIYAFSRLRTGQPLLPFVRTFESRCGAPNGA